jgi:hypothetical protein
MKTPFGLSMSWALPPHPKPRVKDLEFHSLLGKERWFSVGAPELSCLPAQNLEPLVVVVGVVMEHHELANARDSGERDGRERRETPTSFHMRASLSFAHTYAAAAGPDAAIR